MKKQVLVAAFAAVVFAIVSGTVLYAQGTSSGPSGPQALQAGQPSGTSEHFGGSYHHKRSLEGLMKKLGITDDQKKQIRSLYVSFRDRTRKARTDLMALKDEKKTMLLSGKIDQQKLAQIDDQMVKIKGDLLKERFKLKRDRLALLTPEQLDRVADFMAQKSFRAKMKKMHGWKMRSFHG
ncbi:MAG TPA: Spy/CpxP family protein refolding chaperone [Desulfomonilaceae bacterium]|nr:Spy/CpxP family protein refolding chaperone [Desulfomonilaceae bacterium]